MQGGEHEGRRGGREQEGSGGEREGSRESRKAAGKGAEVLAGSWMGRFLRSDIDTSIRSSQAF